MLQYASQTHHKVALKYCECLDFVIVKCCTTQRNILMEIRKNYCNWFKQFWERIQMYFPDLLLHLKKKKILLDYVEHNYVIIVFL